MPLTENRSKIYGAGFWVLDFGSWALDLGLGFSGLRVWRFGLERPS